MATITRVQHVQYDNVSLLAVQGSGTAKFRKSNAPGTLRANFGAVFSGRIRITKSDNAGGYFILGVDRHTNDDRRRVFFRGSAQVRLGEDVLTMEGYYNLLAFMERAGF